MNELAKIIDENHGNMALVLGNGVNYRLLKDPPTWENVMEKLWEKAETSHKATIPKDISLPEICDILGLSYSQDVHELFCSELVKEGAGKPCALLETAKAKGIPILTTNYDLNIEKSLGIKTNAHFCGNQNLGLSDKNNRPIRPKSERWNLYYGAKGLTSPSENFGIWHIHGDMEHKKTICIKQSEYITRIKGAYSMFNAIEKRNKEPCKESRGHCDKLTKRYNNSWLKCFFDKSLCFIGLGLGRDEIFLRWLLLKRRLKSESMGIKPKGWYVYTKAEEMTDGKRAFLEAVGIEIVHCPDFDSIYNITC